MALATRTIQARHKRYFRQQAKLLEAAVRHLAVFSAQSKEAFHAAKEIQLLAEPDAPSPSATSKPTVVPTTASSSERRTDSGLIIPNGVELNQPPTVTQMTGRFEAAVEELPDDADRRVTPAKDESELNQPGSTERLMRMLGGAGPSGLISG